MTNFRLLLLSCFFLIVACNSRSDMGYSMEKSANESSAAEDYSYQEEGRQATPSTSDSDPSASFLPKDRKIIKTADVRYEVEDLKYSQAKIIEKVNQYEAFVSQQDFSSSGYSQENNLTIRVPIDKFEVLLEALSTEALYLDYKRISANDVTEEYVDIEIRLQTKKEVRDRYIDILRNKAKTVEEILMAEEKIRVIQEEIESQEGRLNYLKNQVSLSTIHLNIYQKVNRKMEQQPGFAKKLGRALGDGWEVFLDLILGLAHIWPVLLLAFGLLWGLRRFWKSR